MFFPCLLSYGDGDPSKPHLNLRGKHLLLFFFVLFVLVFEKIASQKLTLPGPYLVLLATVMGAFVTKDFSCFYL